MTPDIRVLPTGLAVDGEHGPLFRGVDPELGPGLHAIAMPISCLAALRNLLWNLTRLVPAIKI
jgi:hypothetical protein